VHNHLIPRKFFLTRGVGVHEDKLVSFEMALRDARIPQFNLVTVSSILPPGCEQVTIDEGLKQLSAGQIVFCVLSRNETNSPGDLISASVAVARHTDPAHHGYIAEHHTWAQTEEQVQAYSNHQAVTMLSTLTDGLNGDMEASAAVLKDTLGITQTAPAATDERWTTVIAAAVFILG
jgi:arginine decarboxylase